MRNHFRIFSKSHDTFGIIKKRKRQDNKIKNKNRNRNKKNVSLAFIFKFVVKMNVFIDKILN